MDENLWKGARIPDDREDSAVFDYICGNATGEEARLRAALNYTAAVLGTILTENSELRAEIERLKKAPA